MLFPGSILVIYYDILWYTILTILNMSGPFNLVPFLHACSATFQVCHAGCGGRRNDEIRLGTVWINIETLVSWWFHVFPLSVSWGWNHQLAWIDLGKPTFLALCGGDQRHDFWFRPIARMLHGFVWKNGSPDFASWEIDVPSFLGLVLIIDIITNYECNIWESKFQSRAYHCLDYD